MTNEEVQKHLEMGKRHNIFVRSILAKVAKDMGIKNEKAVTLFKNGDEGISIRFTHYWDTEPNEYHECNVRIYFCRGCKKFHIMGCE